MTRKIWRARPPVSAKQANRAWKAFLDRGFSPVEMWYASFDGWQFWIAENAAGETDECEAVVIRSLLGRKYV